MIEIIFITALTVLFLHACTWEGMIFSFVSRELKNLPDYIKKPLYDCPICQTPWWGSLILFVGNMNNLCNVNNWYQWIIILFSAAGVNTVLIYIVNQGKALAKTLDESECSCTSKEDKELDRKERLKKLGSDYYYDGKKQVWTNPAPNPNSVMPPNIDKNISP